MRAVNRSAEVASRRVWELLEESQGEGVAVKLASAGFDGGDDSEEQGGDPDDRDQKQGQHQEEEQQAGHDGEADGDLEVERFFAVAIDERHGVFFDQPDDEGAEDVAEGDGDGGDPAC